MTVTNLHEHKNKKKCKKIVKDIEAILTLLTVSQRGLSLFKHYVSVQEIISVLETNKTLLELQKKKYEAQLVEIKE